MAELFNGNTISGSYAEQLQKEHAGSKWGSTGARYSGEAIERVIASRTYITTALDYGCGKGTVALSLPTIQWTEYDPGIIGKQEKPRGRYDLVTCTDVMEHVEADVVDEVVKELAAATGKVLFVDVACYPTGVAFTDGPYKGEDIHITINPPQWWLDKFNSTGLHLAESVTINKYSKGTYKPRIQLTYERL